MDEKESRCRRQAIQLAAQLPEDGDEAERVIAYLKEILEGFLGHHQPEPQPLARFVVVDGGNSPSLRAKSTDSPSVLPRKT